MPYVNIKVTGGAEAPSAKQKAELIEGVTHLLQKVLNKIITESVKQKSRNDSGGY